MILLIRSGQGGMIYKCDWEQAYWQVAVDPRDYRYLRYHWEHHFYFNSVLAMGQHNAAMACDRTPLCICIIRTGTKELIT